MKILFQKYKRLKELNLIGLFMLVYFCKINETEISHKVTILLSVDRELLVMNKTRAAIT